MARLSIARAAVAVGVDVNELQVAIERGELPLTDGQLMTQHLAAWNIARIEGLTTPPPTTLATADLTPTPKPSKNKRVEDDSADEI